LSFEYLITFLNSYAPWTRTQPHFPHIVRKYEVTLVIAMPKSYFLFCTWLEENLLYRKVMINNNLHTKICHRWKFLILEKFRNKNHQIWSYYEGEIPTTKFNSGLKRKRWIAHVVGRRCLVPVTRVRIPAIQNTSLFFPNLAPPCIKNILTLRLQPNEVVTQWLILCSFRFAVLVRLQLGTCFPFCSPLFEHHG